MLPIREARQTAAGASAAQSCGRDAPQDRVLGLRGPARLHPRRLPGGAGRARPRPGRARRRRRGRRGGPVADAELPGVSVIVAAYAEQAVIAERVANLRALDYPATSSRSSSPATARPTTPRSAPATPAPTWCSSSRAAARSAPRTPAVRHARHEITAFSDANVDLGARRAAPPRGSRSPIRRSATCAVRCASSTSAGTNQEGLYWRYEMAVRALESRLASVTGGNGAIYATRRHSYIVVDPIMGHDLSFPFNMVKRGWRAVYAPGARASEKMVPSIEGEFRRKRRMMSHGWPIMVRGGMLSPRGYDPGYAADDRLAPGAALRLPVPARRGAGGRRRAHRAGLGLRGGDGAPGRRCSPPRWPPRSCRCARCSWRATTS